MNPESSRRIARVGGENARPNNAARALWVFGIASAIGLGLAGAGFVTEQWLLMAMAAVVCVGFGWAAIRLIWIDLEDSRWETDDAYAELDDLDAEHQRLQALVKSRPVEVDTSLVDELTAKLSASDETRARAEQAAAAAHQARVNAETALTHVEKSLSMAVDHSGTVEQSLRESQAQLSVARERIGELTKELDETKQAAEAAVVEAQASAAQVAAAQAAAAQTVAAQTVAAQAAPAVTEPAPVVVPAPTFVEPTPAPAVAAPAVTEPAPAPTFVEPAPAVPAAVAQQPSAPVAAPVAQTPVVQTPAPATHVAPAAHVASADPLSAPLAAQTPERVAPRPTHAATYSEQPGEAAPVVAADATPKHAAVESAFQVPDWDDPSWDTLDTEPTMILLSWEAHIRRSGFRVVG